MRENPIRKRASWTAWSVPVGRNGAPGKVTRMREWYAVCPLCKEHITSGAGAVYYRKNRGDTRKGAKDALYRHTMKKHHTGRA